jgi:hypothetical protein
MPLRGDVNVVATRGELVREQLGLAMRASDERRVVIADEQ